MSPIALRISSWLLFACTLAGAGFACGGKTNGGTSSGGSSSGGDSGSGDSGGGPIGECTFGSGCTPGSTCFVGDPNGPCTETCSCVNGQFYSCTACPPPGGDDVGDDVGDDIDASPGCPAAPSQGVACDGEEMQCTYEGGVCGGPTCYCDDGGWDCVEPPCPQAPEGGLPESGPGPDAGIDAFAPDSALPGDTGTPADANGQ